MFLLLCASGDNPGIFLDSPYCRSFSYDNNRASVRTCPCKPLLTLSIIVVMKKREKENPTQPSSGSLAASRTSASLLLFLFRSVRDAADAADAASTAAYCGGATEQERPQHTDQHWLWKKSFVFVFSFSISYSCRVSCHQISGNKRWDGCPAISVSIHRWLIHNIKHNLL